MVDILHSPTETTYWLIPGKILFWTIAVLGLACFAGILYRRMLPLLRGAPDFRLDHVPSRLARVVQFWLAQWKQPRYFVAGVLHIAIFAGFLALSIRSIDLVLLGITKPIATTSALWNAYQLIKDYAATLVFIAVIVAAVRRMVFKPERYAVPKQYGKDHSTEAILVLALIATLMLSESLFEAGQSALLVLRGAIVPALPPLTLVWLAKSALLAAPATWPQKIYLGAYLAHDLTFFAFLCFLPFGKHFHVVTSLFNVYFAKLNRGTVKPVRWGVPDQQIEELKSVGVKKFEDFTWKHMLDFYSCADCGRCSDNCPANAAGRPLSPRFLTIKAREYSFQHYPVLGSSRESAPLVGGIYSEDEIWSCTTCGACEEECPLLIEHIDKIVDLRRGMVDDGNVPKSIQKALKSLESRGNPYGKMEKKRADWVKDEGFRNTCNVKVLNGTMHASTLYFVDSITAYDDRMQAIARATSRILDEMGEDFAILGAAEKDSGHEVRRFGEEMLFMALRDQNANAIQSSGVRRIVSADPHTCNSLKHDYKDLPPVEHITQVMARGVKTGALQFNPLQDESRVYAYHDPCYLGRHNQVYEEPRAVLDAIPGLKRVEMKRCRDRSFCCGGGGLMLFYEPKEDQRMGVQRIQMAADAGANVVVTACPFCMVNLEDAIKVAGMEGSMTAIDLTELVDHQVIRQRSGSNGQEHTFMNGGNAVRTS